MGFSDRDKLAVLAIVHIFETSKPLGDYSAVAVLDDGAGISYGINQFTHRSGSLAKVVSRWRLAVSSDRDDYWRDVIRRLNTRTKASIAALSADAELKQALKLAGKDPEMQAAQRAVMEEMYLQPAIDACEGSHFELPLSLAVIYDSINHGSYERIRDRVAVSRQFYPNGNEFEKAWIVDYVRERSRWLRSVKRLQKTAYRPEFFLKQISVGNWHLKTPMTVHGHKLTEKMISAAAGPLPASQPTDERTKQATDTPQEPQAVPDGDQLPQPPTTPVTQPSPYQGIGFWAVIKKDLAAIFGGNVSFEMFATYAEKASAWPEWVVAMVQKAAAGVLILSIGYLVFRVVHFLVDTWKKSQKTRTEAIVNTDPNRTNIRWVEGEEVNKDGRG